VEPYTVRIQEIHKASPFRTIDVDVILESGGTEIGGFDFLLAIGDGIFSNISVTEGTLGSECEWEVFRHEISETRTSSPWSDNMDTVRVTARAARTSAEGLCYSVDSLPYTLFTLHLKPDPNRMLNCRYIPVRFFWTACDDNRLSVPASYKPLPHNALDVIAQTVLEPSGWEITGAVDTLPGFFGPVNACLVDTQFDALPFVNLINGGIHIMSGVNCYTGIRGLGDVNLNGRPFEVDDSWLFAKYFLWGESAFPNNPWSSIYATDINADMRLAALEDLVLMMRIVVGDLRPDLFLGRESGVAPQRPSPFHPPLPRDGAATLLIQENRIGVLTADTLSAAHFVFDGDITPKVFSPGLEVRHVFDGSVTRVLIYGFFGNITFSSGPLIHWEGDAPLMQVSLATVTGGRVQTAVRYR